MPQKLTLAVSQSRTLSTTSATLSALETTAVQAARSGVQLILFPEAYLGGYPRTCNFGASVGSRTDYGREQFLQYFHSGIEFGDTPAGAGDEWVNKRLPVAKGKEHRGDGTREFLERVARETGVFLVVGAVERAGGSLYCAVVYICPKEGCLGKRRKVMPTGSERLIWAQGSPSTLRAIATTIAGVKLTLAAAICWENYMPLLRFSLYSQNVNLYLAPTADARDTWVPLMQTVACEGRCFVLSANQCMRRENLPEWIKGTGTSSMTQPSEENHEGAQPPPSTSATSHVTDGFFPSPPSTISIPSNDNPSSKPQPESSSQTPLAPPTSTTNAEKFISRGGSCIISPTGAVLAGPLWDVEDGGLLAMTVDFEDCERGRLDLDVAGSYGRRDAFRLEVVGLDISPPPM